MPCKGSLTPVVAEAGWAQARLLAPPPKLAVLAASDSDVGRGWAARETYFLTDAGGGPLSLPAPVWPVSAPTPVPVPHAPPLGPLPCHTAA